MRVGVIRGDLPGSVTVQDLETISQFNPPTEPYGQERHIGRPDPVALTAYLAGPPGVPAGIESVGAVTFPVTIVLATNDVLLIKTASAALYTTATVAAGVYTTMTTFVAAVNAALVAAGVNATATNDSTGTLLVLQSKTPGVGSYISVDTVAHGSTFNGATAGNLGAGGQTFTMPTAVTIITALLPVGGPINVSAANILATLGASPAAAATADLIAPKFIETLVAVQSFQKGMLHGYLSPLYTPDPNRLPAFTLGPAISVVQDDGITAFTAPLPIITGAAHNTPNPGDLTITGVAMASTESLDPAHQTVIHITNPTTGAFVKVFQKVIQATLTGGTQGVVTPTSIVIPASLIGGTTGFGSVVGNLVSLQYTSLANTNYGAAGTITAVANGQATVGGLANMNTYAVGDPLTISGSANPTNNGTFFITSFISATSVTIANTFAVSPDAGLTWSQGGLVSFVTT